MKQTLSCNTELTSEIQGYSGYKQKDSRHRRRDLPQSYPALLEQLINLDPNRRPSAGKVKQVLAEVHLADVIVEEEIAIARNAAGPGSMSIVRRKSISVGTRALSPPVRPKVGASAATPLFVAHIVMPQVTSPPLADITRRSTSRLMTVAQTPQIRILLWLGCRVRPRPSLSSQFRLSRLYVGDLDFSCATIHRLTRHRRQSSRRFEPFGNLNN